MPATLADIQRKYGESVYPLYKDQMHEPYMDNPSGIGVQGAVLYDELEDKIQCSICGEWFISLVGHLTFTHKTNSGEYRDTYGLSSNIPLCGKGLSQKRAEIARKNKPFTNINRTPPRDREYLFKKKSPKKEYNKISNKNKHGLCDAQIAARLLIVRDTVGVKNLKLVRSRMIRKYDPPLLAAIVRKYGSWKKESKFLNLFFADGKTYKDSELISKLRQYVRRNKVMVTQIPFQKEFNVSVNTIKEYFGSWRRAKMMAGLDQLLDEVKSSI